LLLSVKDISIC